VSKEIYLFPFLSSSCLACNIIIGADSLFCPECRQYALRLVRSCPRCGTFVESLSNDTLQCSSCCGKELFFDRLTSPYLYAGAVATAVTVMKYGPRRQSAVMIGRFLAKHVPDDMRSVDRVIYPPMTSLALFLRGFNQAAVIADELTRRTDMFLDTRTLKKTKQTRQQAGLSFEERKKNLEGSFAITQPVTGKRFLLVDDVATTLATANEIARLLKNNGAEKVFVITFARRSSHFE